MKKKLSWFSQILRLRFKAMGGKNMLDKNSLLGTALQDLDLSPTMEKNARDKYEALCAYLEGVGIKSDFYPQGSFLLGTVTRPYKDGKDQNYDLDIICLMDSEKGATTPKKIKNLIGDCIKDSGIYADKLKKEDKHCWTLQYAEIAPGIGFSLDVVPSVCEEETLINGIVTSGVSMDNAYQTVAITNKEREEYFWLTSNPLGFGRWFLDISNRHLTEDMRIFQREKLSKELIEIYAKAEEIPEYFYRSNLQRAVQFLKRSRDIFYERSKMDNQKPSSFILTALVADSVKDRFYLSLTDIVATFISGFKNKTISIMQNGEIINPVDKRENLSKDWTDSTFTSVEKWLSSISKFILEANDEMQLKAYINSDLNSRIYRESIASAKVIQPTKPWRLNNW